MKNEIPHNFLKLPEEFSSYGKSRIVILPVPFDRTSTWIKGADLGPKAIIEASANIEFYEIETRSEIYKKGIFTDKPIIANNSEEMIKKVHEKIKNLLSDKKFVVTLGGDHSVAIPAIRAHAKAFKNMSVLQLDAHSDRREEYEDNRYSHACVVARAKESVKNVVSVGVRSMDSSELESAKMDRIFYAHEIHGKTDWIKKAVDSLSENVYITIDLDVFEIGLMPSTGTPEPGGLGWYEVTRLLRSVAENKRIVGFDVVELCPNERNKAPDALAAKLVLVLLSYVFSGRNRKGI
jgi:agmatinase